MVKIGIYIRVSTVLQDISSQKSQIYQYLEYYRKKNNVESEKEYIDEMTGSSLQRPRLEQLKNDVMSGAVDTVISVKLDRLSRSIQDLLELFNFFDKYKVNVILIKENLDTSTAQGRLLFHIMGAFAEFERETIRERLQMGKEKAKLQGTRSGKPMHRPRKDINIKECIDLYRKGMSLSKLGKYYKVHALTIKSRLVERNVLK